MAQHYLPYKHSRVAWYRFGGGPKKLICFHGYGESADSFEFLGRLAGDEFSFYAIDLPFHGYTDWKEGLLFTHQDLLAIIQAITGERNKWMVMGYSLGGRIALSLYQAVPEQVEKLILLAPDGLKVNFWYKLATRTWAGNRFFRLTMEKPGWFFGLLKALNKLKLVNRSIFKFVNYYIGDSEVRNLLYTRWTSLRQLKPNRPLIKKYIRDKKTPVCLVYGKHDRIILSSVGEKFRKGIEEYCELRIIESGHQILHENYLNEILQSLKA